MHRIFINGQEKEEFKLPSLIEILGYKIFFWSNEFMEPVHVHIAKGKPTSNATKVWLTKAGGCVLGHNKSRIPEKDLNYLMGIITSNYFMIVTQWKLHSVDEEIKLVQAKLIELDMR